MYRIKYDFTYHKTDLVQKFLCDLYMDNTTNIFKELDTAVMFMYLSERGFKLRKWETIVLSEIFYIKMKQVTN